jgi:hypothetical protein
MRARLESQARLLFAHAYLRIQSTAESVHVALQVKRPEVAVDREERPDSLAPEVIEGLGAQGVSGGLRGPRDRQDPPDRVTSRRSLRSRNQSRDWPENSRRISRESARSRPSWADWREGWM